jgi:hypothetical protein
LPLFVFEYQQVHQNRATTGRWKKKRKKEEESRIKLSPRPSPEKRRQNIAQKNKRGILEKQIVRGKAFVLFVRGRTTSAGGAGEQATNEGFVGFFFRHLLPFGQEFCTPLMCSTCAAASLSAFSLAKNLKREKKL